jgi:YD repeat-containing protein
MYYFGYYAHGAIAGTSRANGATTQWGYDGAQRLSAVIHGLAGIAHDAGWTYAYNPASQVRSVMRDNDAYAWRGHYAVARPYVTNGLNQYSATASTTGSGSASAAWDSALSRAHPLRSTASLRAKWASIARRMPSAISRRPWAELI